jgi:hypothetical protein
VFRNRVIRVNYAVFLADSLMTMLSVAGAERLGSPFSIGSVRDGGTYEIQGLSLVQTNLFLRIGRLDELFIKVPTERGIADYRELIQREERHPQDLRPLEERERFARLQLTLEAFPDLKSLIYADAESAHYLAVHKLQFERLRGQTAVEIPRARFGMLQSEEGGLFKIKQPALFQERVRGATLWSMFDFANERVRPRWQRFLPAISGQLAELLDAGLTQHIDWNIKNFVFDETEERLFYVDLKPSRFVAKESNDRNLKGIRDHFIGMIGALL